MALIASISPLRAAPSTSSSVQRSPAVVNVGGDPVTGPAVSRTTGRRARPSGGARDLRQRGGRRAGSRSRAACGGRSRRRLQLDRSVLLRDRTVPHPGADHPLKVPCHLQRMDDAEAPVRNLLAARDDRVGERRPRLQRPRAVVAIGQADERPIERRIDPQESCPTRRNARTSPGSSGCPSSAGSLASRSSKPRPQSSGSKRPTPGRTPIEAREGGDRSLRRGSPRVTSVGRKQLAGEGGEVGQRVRGGPRTARDTSCVPVIASGSRTRRCSASCEGRRRRARRAGRPGCRSPDSSRSGACPGWASTVSPSNGSPEAWASRCRTVAPGGPAGSSRSMRPSSTASSTAVRGDELRHGRPAERDVGDRRGSR